MSRADKFEDEKRRIIESCFGKRETDGSGSLRTASVIAKSVPVAEGFGFLYKLIVFLLNSLGIIHYPHTNPRRCCASFDPAAGPIAARE